MDKIKIIKDIVDENLETFGKQCVLTDDKFEQFKQCWEYANEIVENEIISPIDLDFMTNGTGASIIMMADELYSTKQNKEKWKYLFLTADQITIDYADNYNDCGELKVRIYFTFHTQWLD